MLRVAQLTYQFMHRGESDIKAYIKPRIHRLRAALKAVPGVVAAVRFLERVPYYRRCYRICKWETALPAQAEEVLSTSGFTVRDGCEADLDRLVREETWRSCELYRNWLRAGRRLLLLEEGDNIVSYVWLDFRPEFVIEQVPEMHFKLAPGTYFSDEAYTPLAHRGRGLRRLTFIAELLAAHKEGYRFMVSYFLHDHATAEGMRNFIRTGNSPGVILMEAHVLQVAGFRFTWVRNLTDDSTVLRIK